MAKNNELENITGTIVVLNNADGSTTCIHPTHFGQSAISGMIGFILPSGVCMMVPSANVAFFDGKFLAEKLDMPLDIVMGVIEELVLKQNINISAEELEEAILSVEIVNTEEEEL